MALNLDSKFDLTKPGEKVNLTKGVDLAKGTVPDITINLNWSHDAPKGFFSKLRGTTDLDIGVLYELQNGQRDGIQALGEAWGNFDSAPYIRLDSDDRSGQSTAGETIRVNGQHWQDIKRICVFAYIYSGAANWDATDGVVTITVPGETVEVRMNSGDNSKGMCAIAMLENTGKGITITRLVSYHRGHEKLDEAYGWGLNWIAGSK